MISRLRFFMIRCRNSLKLSLTLSIFFTLNFQYRISKPNRSLNPIQPRSFWLRVNPISMHILSYLILNPILKRHNLNPRQRNSRFILHTRIPRDFKLNKPKLRSKRTPSIQRQNNSNLTFKIIRNSSFFHNFSNFLHPFFLFSKNNLYNTSQKNHLCFMNRV